MTFFSHPPCFSNFPSLLPDFPDLFFSFTLLDIRYRTQPFPHKKNTFFPILAAEKHLFLLFTLFILWRTSDNTTSQNNIGGTNAWAVPHLKLWGTVPQSP